MELVVTVNWGLKKFKELRNLFSGLGNHMDCYLLPVQSRQRRTYDLIYRRLSEITSVSDPRFVCFRSVVVKKELGFRRVVALTLRDTQGAQES